MIFDDGVTTITFFPESYRMRAESFSQLHESRNGSIIASSAESITPRRTRTITLRRTTTEKTALKSFFDTNEGIVFQFTDDVGRVWDVIWTNAFTATEDAQQTDGWHSVSISLFLDAVNSDAGRQAYANADVGQMSIQKSGAAELFFPLAYREPLGRIDRSTSKIIMNRASVSVDASRKTSSHTLAMRLANLSAPFISALEDYFVDTIEGGVFAFTQDHFRDPTAVYRWDGPFGFTLDQNLKYSGSINVREDS